MPTEHQYHTLTIEHDGPIARVWLNRPERRNALNALALEEIAAAFTELQQHFETPVVILGGRGQSFCAGADRKDPPGTRMAKGSGAGARERRYAAQIGRRAVEAIERLEAITIARIHGHAIGGGLVLALACDLRLAAASTVFHIPEVDLGIPLSWGAAPRLAREVGMARAYGYGATMGAWVHDYLGFWAGHDGYIWHSKSQFRGPAFEGDVTYVDGEVIAKEIETAYGVPLVTIKLSLTNQDGTTLVDAKAEVEVPARPRE